MKFCLQEHFAKRYHFDLRLEMDGVAKSWAIPKGFPEIGEKRLAIQVEDHNIEYMDFEGEIEEGYGKGIVKIWDKGEYELLKRTEKEIKFRVNGKKLKGTYALFRFEKGGENSWLLIKTKD
ncbi:MAG: DNA polymerase ligase N-terminal domain-containing protein [Archaeoglobaceae archaeon]|nr:3'-phosphoesterase [Archaeoglobaceae archaeon]MDW7989575.1 DNA polymerase ligase N-terminal domain-containing protein [Archaeoglobaceae archaeon]